MMDVTKSPNAATNARLARVASARPEERQRTRSHETAANGTVDGLVSSAILL